MDCLMIYWPASGDPLVLWPTPKERTYTDDEDECDHDVLDGDVLSAAPLSGLLPKVAALSMKLEAADLAHAGAPRGPLAHASEGAATLFRLPNGWLVARSRRDMAPDGPYLRGSLHTEADHGEAMALFVTPPGQW